MLGSPLKLQGVYVFAETVILHAIQIAQTGGPEVLIWTPIEFGEPGSGQVCLRQAAAGLNYIDVYHRAGYYLQALPFIPGLEGTGTVEAIGQDVHALKVGDRVAYAGPAGGDSEVWLVEGGSTGTTARCDLLRSSSRNDAPGIEASANELFEVVASGKVRINVYQRFSLEDAAGAHKALEARATSGSTILTI